MVYSEEQRNCLDAWLSAGKPNLEIYELSRQQFGRGVSNEYLRRRRRALGIPPRLARRKHWHKLSRAREAVESLVARTPEASLDLLERQLANALKQDALPSRMTIRKWRTEKRQTMGLTEVPNRGLNQYTMNAASTAYVTLPAAIQMLLSVMRARGLQRVEINVDGTVEVTRKETLSR